MVTGTVMGTAMSIVMGMVIDIVTKTIMSTAMPMIMVTIIRPQRLISQMALPLTILTFLPADTRLRTIYPFSTKSAQSRSPTSHPRYTLRSRTTCTRTTQ